jgi:hypothetical protein
MALTQLFESWRERAFRHVMICTMTGCTNRPSTQIHSGTSAMLNRYFGEGLSGQGRGKSFGCSLLGKI